MNLIFLLVGKTNSHKDFIGEHCSYSPYIHVCESLSDIKDGCTNLIVGSLADYDRLYSRYTGDDWCIKVVYVDTSPYTILCTGIEKSMAGGWSCDEMCKTYLSESDDYKDDTVQSMCSKIISADNAVDACYDFYSYVKECVRQVSDNE